MSASGFPRNLAVPVDGEWPHLHVLIGPSQRAGTYCLTLFATGTAQPVSFQSFGTLEEIEGTARGILSAIKEQRRLESPDGIG